MPAIFEQKSCPLNLWRQLSNGTPMLLSALATWCPALYLATKWIFFMALMLLKPHAAMIVGISIFVVATIYIAPKAQQQLLALKNAQRNMVFLECAKRGGQH